MLTLPVFIHGLCILHLFVESGIPLALFFVVFTSYFPMTAVVWGTFPLIQKYTADVPIVILAVSFQWPSLWASPGWSHPKGRRGWISLLFFIVAWLHSKNCWHLFGFQKYQLVIFLVFCSDFTAVICEMFSLLLEAYYFISEIYEIKNLLF